MWGGSDTGLMKVVADGVRETGGRLVGISVELSRGDSARKDADEMVFAKDLAERKALLLDRADAVVVMAGGLGTLDEATEILEQRKHGLHNKPVVLLNTAGFYDGLTLQLRRMEEEGFLPVPLADLVFIADDGARCARLLGGVRRLIDEATVLMATIARSRQPRSGSRAR